MENLSGLLGGATESAPLGFITGYESGMYTVSTDGKTVRAYTAIDDDLDVGSQVVLARTGNGYYIVGKGNVKIRQITEIEVSG